jgi:hypothetical protein
MTELKPSPVQVVTAAPIPLDVLKRKFTEDIEFVIDYEASRLKGKVLITYLSNLKVKCQIKLTDLDETLKLLEEYLNIPVLVDMPDLEALAMNLLMAFNGKPHTLKFDPTDFFYRNRDALARWTRRLYSIPLYALYSMEQYRSHVDTFPIDTDDSIAGVNFVNLIKHDWFPLFMEGVEENLYSWNPTFFKEYVFQGNNLFHYFSHPNNPFFVGLLAIQDPEGFKELLPVMDAAMVEASAQLKGIQHVPSV